MEIKKESIIYPLPSDSLILKKEEFWRVQLPVDYKNFIKVNHGGSPEKKSFVCNTHSYAVIRFLCILEAPENIEIGMFDIDVTWTQLDERLTDDGDLLGVALLPIAVLFAGDFLCLDFRESRNNPKVCVWDHENSAELEPVSHHVADTFDEFMGMLH
ncbi:SMI1/KNR4 family protein [Bacillus thuringiensis]|uniref:SMI1/KNR4 family protein n=1 Tax=Bacillus thuringiensis subsp. higo TaxID=132266 RepID=A0A9X6LZZ2_BACUH|nr:MULTISPECIES: SMI1/KNR4 family protein [Bacillus cereus group]MED2787164.1 SMI1/KNR4 family protein [Bacillus thuringiensis]MED2808477.1 SMI1/KNR4 family protein [Bacillus thuringiensis]MED2827830.1 SMI1/KNR4 family protein [Bacillus thuringiensis]MED2833395.1 SMI1/KNR4 family protein [Bacillus thuringiensis]MED2849339.1 SMI1/KNR4 family protein [Bacillus thuringiensis]